MRRGGVELSFLFRVELQERIGVPNRQDSLAHALADALLGHDEVATAQDRRRHQEPAHGIRTVTVKDFIDVWIIALGLGHLEAIVAQHDAMGYDLLVCRTIKQRGGQRVHHIEPATRLTGVLHDEVRRRVGFKPLFILEGVVLLRERHRAGLEPAVQYVRHATHHRLAGWIVRVRAHQLIDVRAVQGLRADAEVTLQLIQGAVDIHAWVIVIIGHPNRDWRTPVAGTRDIPVARPLEPLAKLTVPNVLRQPLDLIVVELHHAIAELGYLHKPGWQSHVD